MKAITFRGYAAAVDFEPDDGAFVGRLLGTNDVIGFHAESVSELQAALHEAVEDYLETSAKIGKAPEKPYSGQLMLRVAPAVHARAALAAQISGKSPNRWTEKILAEAAVKEARELCPLAAAPTFGWNQRYVRSLDRSQW